MSNWRWWLCSLLFFATTVNYLDRQVLSLTYEGFIKPEFGWTDADYGTITSAFSAAASFLTLATKGISFSSFPRSSSEILAA